MMSIKNCLLKSSPNAVTGVTFQFTRQQLAHFWRWGWIWSNSSENINCSKGLYKKGVLESWQATLYDCIETWHSIQPLYMPQITQLHQINATCTDGIPDSHDREKPEVTNLWLPSSMSCDLWLTGCTPTQQREALAFGWSRRLTFSAMLSAAYHEWSFQFQKSHVSGSGQWANTQAHTLMSQVMDKTCLFAAWYWAACRSLVQLDPNSEWQSYLLPLLTKDVHMPGHNDDDISKGRRELLWIWLIHPQITARDELEYNEGKCVCICAHAG